MPMVRRVVLTAVLLLASCGPAEPVPSEAPIAPEQIRGVIVDVRTVGGEVAGFVVDTPDGSFEILIDPDRDYGFDLRHLEEHRSTEDPVLVDLEARGDSLYAVSILDA